MDDPETPAEDNPNDGSADVSTDNPTDREMAPEDPPPVAGGTYHVAV